MLLENSSDTLSPSLVLLAKCMRKFPKNIRKTLWWWSRLYNKIGGGGFSENPKVDTQWPSGLQKPITGIYGYKLHLNLQNWTDRRAYFSGVYYQTDIIDLLDKVVKPNDQFVDIGANIGFITLHAAYLVGSNGKVTSFEPNPAMQARLYDHIAINNFSERVNVVEAALGETESTAVLHIPENHPGMATLTSGEGKAIDVPVLKGDDVLSDVDTAKPLIIKIDVEGFEQRALSGLLQTLDHPNIMLIIEVTDHLLKRVGDSTESLYELLQSKGFESYIFENIQHRLSRDLKISSCNSPKEEEQYDAVFVKPSSEIYQRLS